MRRAKYIGNDFGNLIVGKVYDVIGIRKNAILIADEYGEDWYSTLSIPTMIPIFEDVTAEIRREIIDEILL